MRSVHLLPKDIYLFITKAFVSFVKCRGQTRKVFAAVTNRAAFLNLMCICIMFFHFFYLCFLKDRDPSQSLKFSASILPLLYWKYRLVLSIKVSLLISRNFNSAISLAKGISPPFFPLKSPPRPARIASNKVPRRKQFFNLFSCVQK